MGGVKRILMEAIDIATDQLGKEGFNTKLITDEHIIQLKGNVLSKRFPKIVYKQLKKAIV